MLRLSKLSKRARAARRWQRLNPTFDAVLKPLGKGRPRRVLLRRIHTEPGVAFTVLRCAECNHRIHLEAHHRYGSGKPRSMRHKDARYRKWRADMLRRKTCCPKCGNDTFRYVRTDVMDHGPSSKLYSELAE